MKILTLSSVFPNPQQPFLGLFVRERMRYVAQRQAVRVVAPVPWSPLDGAARVLKPGYRPARPGISRDEVLGEVLHPRFLCFPGFAKAWDGYLYYRSLLAPVARLRTSFPFDLIDAHFAYPDGMAAMLLARRFQVPFTVTLRGTEVPYARSAVRRPQMRMVLQRAARVISVSASLERVGWELGAPRENTRVIANGVDAKRFFPRDRAASRAELGLPEKAPVVLSVGGLVERKGYHRVIELLPRLREQHPGLCFVVVGGASVEGDFSGQLRALVAQLGLQDAVRFEGAQPPERLPVYYSAADAFVLATANEGWANVFLESLGCGTPVVTTDVGGNREVIAEDRLGTVVPFGDPEVLCRALDAALSRDWDRQGLVDYAHSRSWDKVAERVVGEFAKLGSWEAGKLGG